MRLVLDASALLAAMLEEPGGEIVYAALEDCLISSVNLAEVVGTLARGGKYPQEIKTIIENLKLLTVPPDEQMAIDAGLLRSTTNRAGLSLGDRFCLALARRIGAPVLTSDRNWSKIAAATQVEVRQIR